MFSGVDWAFEDCKGAPLPTLPLTFLFGEMGRVSLSAFVRAAKLKATKDGVSLKAVVESIVLGQFESSVVNGRTLVRTSEGGGSVDFALPEGLTPGDLLELASEALRWIEAQPDPDNPGLPRSVKRLRVCFDRAML